MVITRWVFTVMYSEPDSGYRLTLETYTPF